MLNKEETIELFETVIREKNVEYCVFSSMCEITCPLTNKCSVAENVDERYNNVSNYMVNYKIQIMKEKGIL